MKNYLQKSNRLGIVIKKWHKKDFIQKYKINKEKQNVQIAYMCGFVIKLPLNDNTEEELQVIQQNHFNEIKEKLTEGVDLGVKIDAVLTTMSLIGAIDSFTDSHVVLGSICLFALGLYSTYTFNALQLKKNIQLTSWIYENKESVDRLIEKETKSMVKTQNIDYSTLDYPKEIIEEGITLNNIDLLSNKELKKIKRKVKENRSTIMEI